MGVMGVIVVLRMKIGQQVMMKGTGDGIEGEGEVKDAEEAVEGLPKKGATDHRRYLYRVPGTKSIGIRFEKRIMGSSRF